MRNLSKCMLNVVAIAMVLLIPALCSAAKLTKITGEVLDGQVVGIIVLQAERLDTETRSGAYLLCGGKHVSSISGKRTDCDENARVLLKVTEKPIGRAQMSVLEDAAYQIGHIKDRQALVFVVPNGTKGVAIKPAANFDVAPFRLLGTLELRNGLATLSTNIILKKGNHKIYVQTQEIDPASASSQLQPDQRVALLSSAKTVFVTATGEEAPSGAVGFLQKMATKKYTYADAESAGNDVVKEVNKAKRWTLVDTPENADLVLSIDEANSSLGTHIIDRLWVFKGGSLPDRSSIQPLWFCRGELEYRSASTLAKWLEEDMKAMTEFSSQTMVAVMPLDGEVEGASAKSPNKLSDGRGHDGGVEFESEASNPQSSKHPE